MYVTIDGDAEDATEQLNDDLLQVSQWAENWLVKFNAAKSKALTVTLKTKNTHNLDLPLSLNNTHCMKSEFLCSLWQRKETFMPLYGQL